MHGGDHGVGKRGLHGLPALLCDAKLFPEQRLRRGRSEHDDDAWLEHFDLLLEPWAARANLRVVRLLVNTTFALRAALELEMLDRVREVHRFPIDAGLLERGVEQLAGRTDERMPHLLLLVARLLADEHHRRGLRALPEHDTPAGPESAAPALRRGRAKLRERRARRNVVRGRAGTDAPARTRRVLARSFLRCGHDHLSSLA